MAPYAPGPRKVESGNADLRDVERTALARAFIPKLLAATRGGIDIGSTVPSSAIDRTKSGTFVNRWPDLTPILRSRCPPAALWKMLVRLEPALQPFSFRGNASRERLIARCDVILENRSIWSTGLGLDGDATMYIDGVVRDALALISSLQDARPRARATTRLSSWRYAWTDLRCCDLCWRLVPTGGSQGGFHAHDTKRPASETDRFRFRGHDALCAVHRPSLGHEEKACWKRDQRNRDLIRNGGGHQCAPWHSMTPEAILGAARDASAWSQIMMQAFPLVVCTYPIAAASLHTALGELSGLPAHAVETLIEKIPDDVVTAGIVIIGMLATCEKLLAHELPAPDLKSQTPKKSRRPGNKIRAGAPVAADTRPVKRAGATADQARDHDTSKPQ